MDRTQKETVVRDVRAEFDRMTSAVLTDFRGLTVEADTSLRSELRKAGVRYRVVKNTLVTKAIEGLGLDFLTPFLVGPTGIAWSQEDPSVAAKVIAKFRKTNEKLVVKCGVVEGKLLDAKAVETELATMPGKDEVRATLLATFQAPATDFVRIIQAAPQNFLYLLDAKQRAEGGNGT
jgi:large subunit ribosomal protein L10